MRQLKVTILGCGSSGGVPRVGTGWGECDPSNPRNRRRRCSILVELLGPSGATTVLVDTSPDLRDQLLDAEVKRLDAVLFTHDHADHTHGIDDLRPIAGVMRRRVPVYMDPATETSLTTRFGYCFSTPEESDYWPILEARPLVAGELVVLDGPGGTLDAMPFTVMHGRTEALGFRFGRFAYVPDVSHIPQRALDELRGLELLVIDALRYTPPHPTHFTVADALGLIEQVKPERAFLTNLHTDVDYDQLARRLPPQVEPAYDGLVLTVGIERVSASAT
ncbi:MBL fold metallo-hydrolase [Microvirga massiliensis]|uniref:MBL fold metallo-hydrolase n=1 Tax=Microvirga massiliensis TaxID=1033741 RepID=UPI00062B4FF9|nr:MBL fold metallo-hydrolase [Microvirga massiliensis]